MDDNKSHTCASKILQDISSFTSTIWGKFRGKFRKVCKVSMDDHKSHTGGAKVLQDIPSFASTI